MIFAVIAACVIAALGLITAWAAMESKDFLEKRLADAELQRDTARERCQQLADEAKAADAVATARARRVEELERALAEEKQSAEDRASMLLEAQRRELVDSYERRLATGVEAERTRVEDQLAQERLRAARERQELLDRLLPQSVPQALSPPGAVPARKLHVSEADEIEGLTPARIAESSQEALEAARRLVPYVDEIARQEGVA